MKKRSRTFLMLYYWEKIIGVNPITLSENNELKFSYCGLLHGCIISTMYCYVFYVCWMDRLQLLLPGETPIGIIVDFMSMTSQSFEAILTWIGFAFYQNHIVLIAKTFVKAEEISRYLDIPDDNGKLFKKLEIYLIFGNIIYFITSGVSLSMLSRFPNFRSIFWACYSMPQIAPFNMVMLFISGLTISKHKFNQLNKKVRFLMGDTYPKSKETYGEYSFEVITNSSIALLSDRINMISQMHRELRDIIYRIQTFFTPVLLCSVNTYLLILTFRIYFIYTYLTVTPFNEVDFLSLAAIASWSLVPIITMNIFCNVCGSTTKEANETGNILHVMLNNCKDVDYVREAAEFKVFSLDLLQNQMSISLFGIIDLNDILLYSIVATAISYLIIMLQFYR